LISPLTSPPQSPSVTPSTMSFVPPGRLITTLSALLILTALASGCPGPDCLAINQARQAPVYITTTKPCDGCHHEPTSPRQQSVITITSSKCTSSSVVPYTSGTSTFWFSTPSCPSQPTVTSWMSQNGTCAAPQSAGRATTTLPPITYTTVLPGSCSPSEIYYPGSTIWGTATQLTTITSTIVQTSIEYSVSSASYPGPTIVSTLPGSTQVITYTRPGETLIFTPPASLQTVTWTTNGATVTQTQAASSVTYTSIQAPSYYTVTTSIDALALTTVLAAPTQVVTQSLAGSNVTVTQTLPANTQYLTSVTSIPAYTTTVTQAASTQALTSYQAASYYTVTTRVDAVTVTSVISAAVQTLTATQAVSTQYVTRTEAQAASTFYETTTISLDAITRTMTETSIGLSVSSLETTVTGKFSNLRPVVRRQLTPYKVTSYPFATTNTAVSFVYATFTTTEIASGYPSTLTTTLTGKSTKYVRQSTIDLTGPIENRIHSPPRRHHCRSYTLPLQPLKLPMLCRRILPRL
jgi:hypothetical protein